MYSILFTLSCILMFYAMTVYFDKKDREFCSRHLMASRIVPYMAANCVIMMLLYPFIANKTVIYISVVMAYMMFTCYIDINYKKIYSFPTYAVLLLSAGFIIIRFAKRDLSPAGITAAVIWSLFIIAVFIAIKMGRGDVGVITVYNLYILIISGRPEPDVLSLIRRLSESLLITITIYILYSACSLLYQRVIRKKGKEMIPFAPSVYMAFIIASVNYG